MLSVEKNFIFFVKISGKKFKLAKISDYTNFFAIIHSDLKKIVDKIFILLYKLNYK